MSPDLTLARYGRILRGFLAFHLSWEPRLAAALPNDGLLAGRGRIPLLRHDLADLDLSLDADALPLPDLEWLTSAEDALGSLYVMEGATLGGRLILRHVERVLGLSGDRGCRYFAGYGRKTAAMWQVFRDHVDHSAGKCDRNRIADAACRTFLAIEPLLCPPRRGSPA